jgi:hypothetical protein
MADGTPLTDLQLTLSQAVDQARAIPRGDVPLDYFNLCRTYGDQIFGALLARLDVHTPPVEPHIPDASCSGPEETAMSERRECGEQMGDGSGRVCRKMCAPGRDFHGGGHIFAPPDMTEKELHEGLRQVILGPTAPGTLPMPQSEHDDAPVGTGGSDA